jgi:hypothetical protein
MSRVLAWLNTSVLDSTDIATVATSATVERKSSIPESACVATIATPATHREPAVATIATVATIQEFQNSVVDPTDNRIICKQCVNLTGRRCFAAARGEIVASRNLEPIRDLRRRCEAFRPLPADPDQRTGAERWPGLERFMCGVREEAEGSATS